MLQLRNGPGFAIGNRRFDAGDVGREDDIAALATLDPGFNPTGKSDVYIQGRLDHARECLGTADAAMLTARHDMADAWKSDEQRADATSAIDPDEAMRQSRERNANAWKR